MPSNFPTSLDTYAGHNPGDVILDTHVDNVEDAIEAIEATVGITGSAVTASHDYRIATLESAAQYEIWVDDQAGATDDLKMQAAYDAAVAALRAASNWTNAGTVTIKFSPRNYSFTSDGCMMAAASVTGPAFGIRYEGINTYGTSITFTPTADAYLFRNDKEWGGIFISNIEFIGAQSGGVSHASFLYGNRQDPADGFPTHFWMEHCRFRGDWEYGYQFAGIDNLDTWGWLDTHINGTFDTFFWSNADGTAPTSSDNQCFFTWLHSSFAFTDINYVFRLTRGGNFSWYGGSMITGSGAANAVWFWLETSIHNDGATRFNVNGVRGEIHGTDSLVIDCEWADGTVEFVSCDLAGVSGIVGSWVTARFQAENGGAYPLVAWERCKLQGQHEYQYQSTVVAQQMVTYRECEIRDYASPDDFIVYAVDTSAGTGNIGAKPVIRFENCRSPLDDEEIWDCTLGWHTSMFGRTTEKYVFFRDNFGASPSNAITPTITRKLPMNCEIIEIGMAWDGSLGGGTIQAQTGEGTPTVLLTTSGTALTSANSKYTTAPYRFRCDSDAKRTISFVADASVSGWQTEGNWTGYVKYRG